MHENNGFLKTVNLHIFAGTLVTQQIAEVAGMQSQKILVDNKCFLLLLADEDLYSFTVQNDPSLCSDLCHWKVRNTRHNLLCCNGSMFADGSFAVFIEIMVLTLAFRLVGLEAFADMLAGLSILAWHLHALVVDARSRAVKEREPHAERPRKQDQGRERGLRNVIQDYKMGRSKRYPSLVALDSNQACPKQSRKIEVMAGWGQNAYLR